MIKYIFIFSTLIIISGCSGKKASHNDLLDLKKGLRLTTDYANRNFGIPDKQLIATFQATTISLECNGCNELNSFLTLLYMSAEDKVSFSSKQLDSLNKVSNEIQKKLNSNFGGNFETELFIPTDDNAVYFIEKHENSKNGKVLVTRRIGRSGTLYSKRLFDCKRNLSKYLGNGESILEMEQSVADKNFSQISKESIVWHQKKFICKA